MIHDYEQPELSQKDKDYLDSLPSFDVWWNKMQERIKKSNEKWAAKKKAEREKGIYK